MRIHDPLKQWKLSPMDVEARARWEQYTMAKEEMLENTHIPEAPWWIVDAVDKKRARLNCISHLLTQIPYPEVQRPPVVLPARVRNPDYHRGPVSKEMYVPAVSERASGATPAHIADIGDAHATLIPPLVATLAIY